MLLHIVLAGEALVALGTEGVLLAHVASRVARGVARGGEGLDATEFVGHRADVKRTGRRCRDVGHHSATCGQTVWGYRLFEEKRRGGVEELDVLPCAVLPVHCVV